MFSDRFHELDMRDDIALVWVLECFDCYCSSTFGPPGIDFPKRPLIER